MMGVQFARKAQHAADNTRPCLPVGVIHPFESGFQNHKTLLAQFIKYEESPICYLWVIALKKLSKRLGVCWVERGHSIP